MPESPDTPGSPDIPGPPSANTPRLAVPGKGYREVTLSAIVFGIVVGVIMNAAITYSGLKIGFTIVGSAIAAVLGFGVLRGLLRRGSILETNIGQTIASSVNTTNAGVIFTVPVLLLLGYSLDPGSARFWLVTLACMAGAVMGAAFIIPLRKQMIDIDRLRFPSGTAVGAILKSPGAGVKKTIVLLAGIVIAVIVYLPVGLNEVKSEAAVEHLGSLVAKGRISPADRALTLDIAGWIQSRSAPEPVVERGRALSQLRAIEKTIRDEGADTERERRADALRQTAADLADQADYSDKLLIAVAKVADGQAEWESLRNKRLGWAKEPIAWGYGDIGWHLPPDRAADAQAREDLDGDGTADVALTERVDHDQNGHPDPILSDSTIDVGRFIGLPDSALLVFAIAPFAIGAGYLSGRAGLMVLAGGVLAYLIINPILFTMGYLPDTLSAADVSGGWGRNHIGKPLGIGLLLGGALMGVIVALPSIRAALGSVVSASRTKAGRDELGLRPLLLAAAGAFAILFLTANLASQEASNRVCPVTNALLVPMVGESAEKAATAPEGGFPTVQHRGYTLIVRDDAAVNAWNEMPREQRNQAINRVDSAAGPLSDINRHVRSLIIALIGTLWIWFAGIIIAQCTGMTDWSPISGIALLTVVLVMVLAGVGSVIPAVLVGATLCCAITMAADMMADLRTGYIVGAKPKRQQVVELATTWIGPIVCMFTLLLIAQANMAKHGVPMGTGTETIAPQAEALKSVIIGVQGGDMPYTMYGLGGLLGLFLGLGSFPGLGVLVGLSMYLPFFYISTYGIGCIANIVIGKIKGRAWAEEWGVPLAAGLIVGEAILSLILNAIIVIMDSVGAQA